jgi:hypothetical protein
MRGKNNWTNKGIEALQTWKLGSYRNTTSVAAGQQQHLAMETWLMTGLLRAADPSHPKLSKKSSFRSTARGPTSSFRSYEYTYWHSRRFDVKRHLVSIKHSCTGQVSHVQPTYSHFLYSSWLFSWIVRNPYTWCNSEASLVKLWTNSYKAIFMYWTMKAL